MAHGPDVAHQGDPVWPFEGFVNEVNFMLQVENVLV